ncbi:MAG: hypothetical protein ACI9H8_001699 [Lysobacterales bacterium]|jgi:hypothetical protein
MNQTNQLRFQSIKMSASRPIAELEHHVLVYDHIENCIPNLIEAIMRRIHTALVFLAAILTIPSIGWSKGETIKIKIEGDNLKLPVEIMDPSILSQFNIWNGPGVVTRGPDGVPHFPAHLDSNETYGRFIDWPRGIVAKRPSELQRFEITFYIGVPQEPNATRKFVFAYEVELSHQRGFIFLPYWKNDLISHGVELNWFYASKRWDELIMPIILQHSTNASLLSERGNLKCKVGEGSLREDGTIEFVLLDENGNRTSRWRYDTSNERYQIVKDHIGNVQPGEEIEVSCWPPRS